MRFETRFSVADEVWVIMNRRSLRRPCKFCEATGEIVGKNSQTGKCPECDGSGQVSPFVWMASGPWFVNSINKFISLRPSETYGLTRDCVTLVAEATWDVGQLYASEEDAKHAAGERNSSGPTFTFKGRLGNEQD